MRDKLWFFGSLQYPARLGLAAPYRSTPTEGLAIMFYSFISRSTTTIASHGYHNDFYFIRMSPPASSADHRWFQPRR
jgi:hypothetical protein